MQQNKQALFFSQDFLITDRTGVPFLPYQETLEKLELEIELHCSFKELSALQCKIKLDEVSLFEKGYQLSPVKALLPMLDTDMQLLIIRACHRIQWEAQSRFCGQCGDALEAISYDASEKRCLQCDKSFFPRFSPAVIVAVQREHEILLARSPHFTEGMYSALAGFIDLGETAEMAAHREVEEEVGIKITNLEYVGSQTWPFPDSFMIGFKATYVSGDLLIDTQELESAKWFPLDGLPKLPGKASIARILIEKIKTEYFQHQA